MSTQGPPPLFSQSPPQFHPASSWLIRLRELPTPCPKSCVLLRETRLLSTDPSSFPSLVPRTIAPQEVVTPLLR